ncbi:MAG TPA: hypothetical protein PLS95_01705 [Thermoanaerobaculales bacterium]|nr:hypothetical protein [Thermoanaerobaculales bacterium]HQN95420.1 hypothetical protein [Thermoanaerobaculales bacterium]HQP44955.1 hypothetical protein [Thermoanaerobaculales bacterium]
MGGARVLASVLSVCLLAGIAGQARAESTVQSRLDRAILKQRDCHRRERAGEIPAVAPQARRGGPACRLDTWLP